MTADPGDPWVTVDITVVRAPSFTDDVTFSISAPAGITTTTAVDTGNSVTTSSFTVTVNHGVGDEMVIVTGSEPHRARGNGRRVRGGGGGSYYGGGAGGFWLSYGGGGGGSGWNAVDDRS